MRKLFILFGFALFATSIAQAQETRGMEVSGQYQYVRIYPGSGSPSANCQGAGGTFAANVNRWVGVVGDVGYCKLTGQPTGASAHEINYLFGPRFSYRNYGRVTPYAQVLFGGERLTASVTGFPSASTNAFAMTFGGGADFQVSRQPSVSRDPVRVSVYSLQRSQAEQSSHPERFGVPLREVSSFVSVR